MQRRLVLSVLALVAVALALFTVPVARSSAELLRENQAEVGLREARTVAGLQGIVLAGDADRPEIAPAREAVAQLRALLEAATGGRVELVDPSGRPTLGREVLDPQEPALQAALRGEEQVFRRTDSVIGRPALEVIVPARTRTGEVVGAVRLTYPTEPVDDQIREIWLFRTGIAVAVLGLAAVAALGMARRLTRPLRDLDAMAARLSAGDFEARAPEAGPPETRTLARTLNDGARRLGTLVTAQQRFVGDASHQLRTPLTALRLHLDNLQDQLEDRSTRNAADRAIAEVVRMTKLVNDLLALARIEATNKAPVRLDVAAVVEDRLVAWRAAAETHHVQLVTDVRAVHVTARPGDLEQVLDNLLSNALAEAPEGSAIVVSAAPERDAVLLRVCDQGPGMGAEAKEHAFDRFWQGRPGGTGLGLAIVRQLVEDNRGTVRLQDAEPRGLCVDVRLPTADPPR